MIVSTPMLLQITREVVATTPRDGGFARSLPRRWCVRAVADHVFQFQCAGVRLFAQGVRVRYADDCGRTVWLAAHLPWIVVGLLSPGSRRRLCCGRVAAGRSVTIANASSRACPRRCRD